MTRSPELQKHWDTVGAMGCCVCGARPVELHHAGGGSMKDEGFHKAKGLKNNDWLVLPLCKDHHTGANGIHTGVQTWETLYGTQVTKLRRISRIVGYDALARARVAIARRPYRRPSKIFRVAA